MSASPPRATANATPFCVFATLAVFLATSFAEPIPIGSRLELLVDDFLIEELTGDAEFRLHQPVAQEVALVTDAPWEGNTSAYYTIFRDGDLYRMYYRGMHVDETKKATHREVACYAESRDGLHWEKPDLGLFEWDGSKENNIVWDGAGCHNFTVFRDGNPATPPHQKYRALARVGKFRTASNGLRAFESADAVNWKITREEPVITAGAFDSQNLAFWDAQRGEYRAYWRIFTDKVRAIRTATSKDFLEWENQADLTYPSGTPKQHLYTNAVQPYFRAPHIFIAFPTRYLPEEGQRVEPILMTSRDGLTFRRWHEALIPETAPKDRAGNRSNYMAWGIVELPGKPGELSVYASEAYYEGPDSRLRRFTFRKDGFVSVHASSGGGEILTKPVTFRGDALVLNCVTSGSGTVRVEIQDAGGDPIPGFGLDECVPVKGDHIEHVVRWKGGGDLGALAASGKAVRLRVALRSADLFAFRFR